jgi:hypothetical protein
MLWLIDDRIDASTRDAGTRKNPNARPDAYAANNVVPAGNAAKTTAPRSAPIKAASCFTSKEASPARTTCQATKPMTAPKHPDPNISKVIVLPRSPCLTRIRQRNRLTCVTPQTLRGIAAYLVPSGSVTSACLLVISATSNSMPHSLARCSAAGCRQPIPVGLSGRPIPEQHRRQVVRRLMPRAYDRPGSARRTAPGSGRACKSASS